MLGTAFFIKNIKHIYWYNLLYHEYKAHILVQPSLYFFILVCCAVLWCVMLYCVVLCCAVLCCAVLCCAVLCCGVLCCVVLCCVVL